MPSRVITQVELKYFGMAYIITLRFEHATGEIRPKDSKCLCDCKIGRHNASIFRQSWEEIISFSHLSYKKFQKSGSCLSHSMFLDDVKTLCASCESRVKMNQAFSLHFSTPTFNLLHSVHVEERDSLGTRLVVHNKKICQHTHLNLPSQQLHLKHPRT